MYVFSQATRLAGSKEKGIVMLKKSSKKRKRPPKNEAKRELDVGFGESW